MYKTTNIIEMESSSFFLLFWHPKLSLEFHCHFKWKVCEYFKNNDKNLFYSTMNVMCDTKRVIMECVCGAMCAILYGVIVYEILRFKDERLRHNPKEKLFGKIFYYFKSFRVEHSANMYNFAITFVILFAIVNKRYVYVLCYTKINRCIKQQLKTEVFHLMVQKP